MLFTSPFFLFIFLPITLFINHFIPNKYYYRNIFLLLASSFFYYYGEQERLLLMYFVIGLNYLTALYVETGTIEENSYKDKSLKQKACLCVCITICVGLLWYFKYLNFTVGILNSTLFVSNPLAYFDNIVLPLGISFYTFHVLSYTLDVYFGRLKVEKNILNLASYVLMFPQLVAGPIVRYIDIKRQFYKRTITTIGMFNGIRMFCYGMAKKVLIANTLAIYVDQVFSKPVVELSTLDCWMGAITYSLQIYFDFSGYSTMAIGLAMLFGFRYKENFNYPYIAKTAGEFWHRWHISLSSWLRDYVYISMGGNRVASWRKYLNIILVFLCSGLWHGANYTFVCWGLLYGVFISLEGMGLKRLMAKVPLLSNLYLIVLAVSGWVVFRADDITYAGSYLANMYGITSANISGFTVGLEKNVICALVLGIIFSYDWRLIYKHIIIGLALKCGSKNIVFIGEKFIGFALSIALFVLSVSSVISSSHNPFIYFRF